MSLPTFLRIFIRREWKIVIIISFICIIISYAVVSVASLFIFNNPVLPHTVIREPVAQPCRRPTHLMDQNGLGVVPADGESGDIALADPIGLSDGKFPFNIRGNDKLSRCLASQALNQGHVDKAKDDWNKAITEQPNDPEVLIYQENQRVLDSGHPSVGVIVGVEVTPTTEDKALDILQGAYIAQINYNQMYVNGPLLRVIIANFGHSNSDATTVAQQILNVEKSKSNENQLEALVNLPASASSGPVLDLLASGGFPIVLASGSVDRQQDLKNHNVFHIVATTSEQGIAAAQYVKSDCPNANEAQPYDCKGPNIAVFIDSNDNYSRALGGAFMRELQQPLAGHAQKFASPYAYDGNNADSIKNEVKQLDLLPPDLIYFAGNASDANYLIDGIKEKYPNIRVLGGDELYQTAKYGQDRYKHLNFTAFAYADQWEALSPPSDQSASQSASQMHTFTCAYMQHFGGIHSSDCKEKTIYGYSRAESDVILAYDALSLVLENLAPLGDSPSYDQLVQRIQSIDEDKPFDGASGRIVFGPDHNPINRTIFVLRVTGGYTRLEQRYGR